MNKDREETKKKTMRGTQDVDKEGQDQASSEGSPTKGRRLPWRVKLTLVACFLLEFTAGIQYTFGNLLPYFTSYLRVSVGMTSVDYSDTMWVGECNRMTFSIVMPLLGLVLPRLPPRLHFILGFLAFAVHLFGSYWAIQQSLAMLIVFYGVLQGIGKAVFYPSAVSLALRWVPGRKGLVGGLVMAGYGGGALVWNQVVTNWINPDNLQPDLADQHDLYFTQPEVLSRVPTCFLLLGGIIGSMQLLCILVLTFPPPPDSTLDVNDSQQTDEPTDNSKSDSTLQLKDLSKREPLGKKEEHTGSCSTNSNDLSEIEVHSSEFIQSESDEVGEQDSKTSQHAERESINAASALNSSRNGVEQTPSAENGGVSAEKQESERIERQPMAGQPPVDYTPLDLLRTRAAWTLCLAYFATELTIIFVADLHKAYGQTFIHDDHYLAIISSCAAIFNSGGRPAWGWLADKIGFLPALLSTQALLSVAAATFLSAESLGEGRVAFALWVFAMYWAISGVYSLEPSLTFSLFGPTHFTANLGLIRITGVASSLLSVFVASAAKNAFGYHGIFLVGSACTIVGMLINATFLLNCGCHLPPHTQSVLFYGRQSKNDVTPSTSDVNHNDVDAGQGTTVESEPSSKKEGGHTSA